jgi:uncharacterized protein (DUF1778 family)
LTGSHNMIKLSHNIASGQIIVPAKKLSAHQRRETRLTVPMTISDTAKIERAAEILHLPKSTWARAVILEKADKVIAESKAAK